MTDSKPIVVFDSGIGGLSILKEISRHYPYLIYIADQQYFPYGEKSDKWINNRLKRISSWILKQNPLALVIACNTATVSSINGLRKIHNFPIIGVEPTIKPLSKYNNTLLLATNSTLQSKQTKKLIKLYHPTNLHTLCPKNLVNNIEDTNSKAIQTQLSGLKPILENVEAIGLSCTHYPLIKNLIQQYTSADIIDPSEAVARQLIATVKLNHNAQKPTIDWYTTGEVVRLAKQVKYYLGKDIYAKKLKL